MQKKNIYVKPESTYFWRALYGLAPASSEEIDLHFKTKNPKVVETRHLDIITKGFLQEMDGAVPDDILNYEELFNANLDELLQEDQILYGYEYDDPCCT